MKRKSRAHVVIIHPILQKLRFIYKQRKPYFEKDILESNLRSGHWEWTWMSLFTGAALLFVGMSVGVRFGR